MVRAFMDPVIHEWLHLAIRWLHVIAGIAWIGSSFFFMWLDSHLEKVPDDGRDVEGELWMVHSGGFYQVDKFMVVPPQMPSMLHWFKWEAYFTWISGFLLLGIVYYHGANTYLLDPSVSTIPPSTGIAIGLGVLLGGWIVYDLLCRSPLGKHTAAFSVVGFILLIGLAFGLSKLFSGRGTFIHVGALMGTLMAGNVWRVIIPNQKKLVDALKAGEPRDPSLGEKAKQRSVHNNYMTLPVVFIMISNHFPSTYGNQYLWAVLGLLCIVGGLVRHFFNLRNAGQGMRPWPLALAAVLFVGLTAGSAMRLGQTDAVVVQAGEPVSFTQARAILELRCVPCHSATPSHPDHQAAPLGIAFNTPLDIQRRAERIQAVSVITRQMPQANSTGMTDEEREILGRWILQGAQIN
jgi:uncharacterized membrane protein